jgi:hypothetical protein
LWLKVAGLAYLAVLATFVVTYWDGIVYLLGPVVAIVAAVLVALFWCSVPRPGMRT